MELPTGHVSPHHSELCTAAGASSCDCCWLAWACQGNHLQIWHLGLLAVFTFKKNKQKEFSAAAFSPTFCCLPLEISINDWGANDYLTFNRSGIVTLSVKASQSQSGECARKIGFSSNRLRSLGIINHFKYIAPSSGTGSGCERRKSALIKRSSSLSDRCCRYWECADALCDGCASFPLRMGGEGRGGEILTAVIQWDDWPFSVHGLCNQLTWIHLQSSKINTDVLPMNTACS